MFSNFKVKGPADRTVVYLTCFIQKCLEEIKRQNDETKARQIVDQIVKEAVDANAKNFFMRALGLLKEGDAAQAMKMAKYLKECKEECAKRLLNILYDKETGDMDRKYWLTFGKRLFLGQKFTDKNFHV